MGAWNWFSEKEEEPNRDNSIVKHQRFDFDNQQTLEMGSDIEMDSNLDPNFDELYEIWGDMTSFNNSLFEFHQIKNFGDDNNFYSAKFYKDNSGETNHLTLYLKDYIFSSYLDHPNILKIKNSFK